MHTLADTEGHCKELLLFPDYSSTGLWCSCGLGLGNPEDVLDIPERLIKLVDLWNHYWELTTPNHKGNQNPFLPEIIMVGEYIAEEISKYIPCTLDKERCAL